MSTPIETERKFLIKIPVLSALTAQEGSRVMHLEQTYLLCESGKNARVRKITESGRATFVKTVKQRISALSCYEDEQEITEEQYTEELAHRDTAKKTVIKDRYTFPFDGHTVEIDVYPFWEDRAILEVELHSEDERLTLPDFIEVVKEVSEDKRYKNTNIANEIPYDEI